MEARPLLLARARNAPDGEGLCDVLEELEEGLEPAEPGVLSATRAFVCNVLAMT